MTAPRHRLAFHAWPAAIYAIGDVHGCLAQLQGLEAAIAADGLGIEGEKWLVTLGDHIDRGPHSREVVAHVMGPAPAGFRRFSLIGNHEQLLLDFLDDPHGGAAWLAEGGADTVRSYGLDPEPAADDPALLGTLAVRLSAAIPAAQLDFLNALPVYLSLPGWLFVHAGLRPGIPLGLQTDADLTWIREPFLSAQMTGGLRIVHGHTPAPDIVMMAHRIDVDSWCYKTGRLSAVRVTPDGRTRTFSVDGPPAIRHR